MKLQRRVQNVFIIIATSVLFGTFKNIFLARELTQEEMGLFYLAMTIVGFVYPLSMFGQQKSIVRFFSRNDPSIYNWKRGSFWIVCWGTIFTSIVLVVVSRIYHLTSVIIVFTMFAILSSVVAELFTNFIRSQGHYELAIFLQRSVRFILPVVLVLLYIFGKFELLLILLWFSTVYVVLSLIILGVTYTLVPSGEERLPTSMYWDNAFFVGLDLSALIMALAVNFFIAKMISIEALGIYFAIFSVMRVYDLANQAIEYILMPHSIRLKKKQMIRVIIQISGIAVFISLFYFLFGQQLVEVLFKGKYNEGIGLIPLFAAVGFANILNVVPLSVIGGRLEQEVLKRFFYFSMCLAFLTLFLNAWFIYLWQLIGALIALLIIAVLRLVIGYTILFKYYDQVPLGDETFIEYSV
ncbi:MAG: oligosaccharide flippase family protein [Candidatus Marinimicrobia bacterium]|nr:oligosaccharide flippase family protein [Candidatus Neomarinimicrobiota bacterium]